MKTIFITSFHVLISRNILRSGILDMLCQNARVVILAPQKKKEFFKKKFSGKNVIVEGVDTTLTKKDLLFRRLSLACSRTETLYIKKRSKLYQDKKLFSFFASIIPSYICSRSRAIILFLRFLDAHITSTSLFQNLIEQYNPDLVFSTDVQNEFDVRLLHEAKRHNIETAGMVRSWDNLTSKGILRVIPERLIVNNEIIKKEALQYNFLGNTPISVIGIPHYDRYVEVLRELKKKRERKHTFFKQHGFDEKKKVILFAPAGNRYIRNNTSDLETLQTLSLLPINILVRMPPTDEVDLEGFESAQASVSFDHTGTRFQGGIKTSEISEKDDIGLIHSLYYSDLLVTGLSTMCIDAALFDVPIISICFDKGRNYWDSFRRYHRYEHIEPLVKSGGVRFVYNSDELLATAKEYSDNPSRDKKGRERIVKEQIYRADGLATKRLFDILHPHLL